MPKDNQIIELNDSQIEEGLHELGEFIKWKVDKKGRQAFFSRHQIYGMIAEEVNECLDEIQKNDDKALARELLDVALVAIWGWVSLKNKGNGKG